MICCVLRYDLDDSGTLNSQAEFYSLTLNILLELKHRKPAHMNGTTVTTAIEALLAELGWSTPRSHHLILELITVLGDRRYDFDDNHES